jgi:hypothetical protein
MRFIGEAHCLDARARFATLLYDKLIDKLEGGHGSRELAFLPDLARRTYNSLEICPIQFKFYVHINYIYIYNYILYNASLCVCVCVCVCVFVCACVLSHSIG